jgi:hypothetical protein
MRMKKEIKKPLEKINAFLESGEKPTLKIIHQLRLEVKHLQAFSELVILQNNFDAAADVSGRLGKLFDEAGKLRKFGLEIKAIESISAHNRLSKPILFIEQLGSSKKKYSRKLRKIKKRYPAFRPGDFIKDHAMRFSSDASQQFFAGRAAAIMDLIKQDITSDIKSLHQLRKILKSILYVMPVCKNGVKPIGAFLKTRERFMKSVESKIGSMHDTDSFLRRLEKKHDLINAAELSALRKIKREWQHDIVHMKKDLKPLLPALRQFAIDLQNKSAGDLNPVPAVSN